MTELGQHRIFPDFKRQRARMVKLLEEQGITDEAVLAAMRTVRRHLFVPEALQGRAYEDHALPIGFGQTISQPYIVAFMSQLLEAKPGMKVLEIGTGIVRGRTGAFPGRKPGDPHEAQRWDLGLACPGPF